MRTTIEMKPEHRTALLALASRRGQKGFSAVLGEAIENYLRGEADRKKRRRTLLAVAGSLSPEEADRLRRAVRELRENWR
jgi:putative antitoxin of VapBC-like toxin-antitoxin system